jgi:hypothetical protein
MRNYLSKKDVLIILALYIASRLIAGMFGVHLEYDALYKYWQYLDEETLRHNLLNGVWYDHAQPPFFNLLVGWVLKMSGSYAPYAFAFLFKLITLANTLLLYVILKRVTGHARIPLWIALFYMLSPAAIVYENELFYTGFVSLLFLACTWFIISLSAGIGWKQAAGIFLPLLLISMTRSFYHLAWLVVISVIILWSCRKKRGIGKLVLMSFLSLLLTAGWYVKNYMIFGQFSTSSWIGMNLSRNVFHDNEIKDSSRIEAYLPFSSISTYERFLPQGYEERYAGLNDRDLLQETKNGLHMNLNHVGYIEVSKQYMDACKRHIKAHPVSYAKNVLQSAIIFFAPATRYSVTEFQARKIKYYDIAYSFNLSHFAKGKQQRRIAITLSAVPKIILYFVVFSWLLKDWIRRQRISLLNLFIGAVIGYVFVVSSLLEHYENMRFRFETEPLFLILLGIAVAPYIEPKGFSQRSPREINPTNRSF